MIAIRMAGEAAWAVGTPAALPKPSGEGVPMRRHALLLALSLASAVAVHAVQRVPLEIFTDFGLTPQQIAAIDAGQAVAKILPWGGPSEVYVFGAVHVEGSPDTYLEAARDIGRLSRTPGYQGAGEIREDATVADLIALAFEPDDVKALKKCREDSCDVQLPTSGIEQFRDGVDWSRPDAADQANALAGRRCCDSCRRIGAAETRRSANIGTSRIPRVSPTSSRRWSAAHRRCPTCCRSCAATSSTIRTPRLLALTATSTGRR
ncbi:MAG: hypothetical protein MZV70_07750 [Desulfobacterales bacterium]|nr:hypothetical protein [Desulfobacterales bacterium]